MSREVLAMKIFSFTFFFLLEEIVQITGVYHHSVGICYFCPDEGQIQPCRYTSELSMKSAAPRISRNQFLFKETIFFLQLFSYVKISHLEHFY